MLLETLLFLVLILCFIQISITRSRTAKYLKKIHGPSGWPIIGSILDILLPADQLWLYLRKTNKQYYPLYKVRYFQYHVLSIVDAVNAELLLSSTRHIKKGLIYDYFHPWFGTGLLTSTGSKWQTRRKILTRAFHFNVLQKYADIIVENLKKAVQSLKAEGESVQNLVSFITNHSLNLICEAAMGTSLQGKQDKIHEYRKAVHEMGDVLIYRIVRPWFISNWIFDLTSKGRKQKKCLQILHKFSANIIEERKEYHERTKGHFLKEFLSNDAKEEQENDEIFGVRKKRLAMLDLLIAAYRDEKIDDPGIREEVDTFMFEGHDTVAMSLCFCLLLIAEHKDVQTRIRAEVSEVLATSGGKMGLAKIQRLNYLERCVKESLRLYPSVQMISRTLEHDLHLKDHVIPRGTMIDLHIYDIHRDPNHWSEPDKFDPDRFLPERSLGRHPFAYIPFSAGSRNCIGQKFAMMELKVFVAYLVQNFDLESADLAHEVPILPDLVLRPARPIYVKFVPIAK